MELPSGCRETMRGGGELWEGARTTKSLWIIFPSIRYFLLSTYFFQEVVDFRLETHVRRIRFLLIFSLWDCFLLEIITDSNRQHTTDNNKIYILGLLSSFLHLYLFKQNIHCKDQEGSSGLVISFVVRTQVFIKYCRWNALSIIIESSLTLAI